MKPTRTEILFGAVMLGAAIFAALIAHRLPAAKGFIVPPFAWPLFAALLFDLAVMPLVRQERMEPLRHGARVTGVIAAAILVVALTSAGA